MLEHEFIDFQVGQRWKTQMGQTYIIKEIRDEEYALVCISLDTGKKHFFDEDGYEVPGYPTDSDLIENIS